MNSMQFYEPFNAPEPISTKLSTVCRVVSVISNDFAYPRASLSGYFRLINIQNLCCHNRHRGHTGAIAKRMNTVKNARNKDLTMRRADSKKHPGAGRFAQRIASELVGDKRP